MGFILKTLFKFKRIFPKLIRAPIIFYYLGLRRIFYLIYVYFFLPHIMRLVPYYIKLYQSYMLIRTGIFINKEMNYLRSIKKDLLKYYKYSEFLINVEDLGLNNDSVKKIRDLHKTQNEVIIADIDQDGFLLSYYGPIKNAPMISKEKFMKRKRYKLNLVSVNGLIGVKKYYKDDMRTFISEISILYKLIKSDCNVPAILDVDFDKLTFTHAFISGYVLREELAKRGAVIRDRDVEKDKDLKSLSLKEVWLERVKEGKKYLYDVVDQNFISNLFLEFQKIHSSGIRIFDVKYGNIVIENITKRPFYIDFNSSQDFSDLNKKLKRIACDFDINLFNLHFNTNYFTYKELKKRIKQKDIPFLEEWYSPVNFGYGLKVGSLWDLEHGDGRWHFILRKSLPVLSGKRILDLGANTGFNSIQMLRNGADEAIGIEYSEKYIAQGDFLKSAFEWADNRNYNFTYINSDMADVPKMNLGEFDIVIALCSIYYLDDDQITKLIRYISGITGLFIVQCNIRKNIGRDNPITYEKASVEYTIKKLKENGFPKIRVIAPRFYQRPLVIAAK